jgi:hypothetical protein
MGGPRILDLKDVPEQEVVRIEFGDGRSASIFERRLTAVRQASTPSAHHTTVHDQGLTGQP